MFHCSLHVVYGLVVLVVLCVLMFVFFFLMIRRPPRSTRTEHSFPTRRSSDLLPWAWLPVMGRTALHQLQPARSEEHTSELQSLMRISYAVFCLKKTTKQRQPFRVSSVSCPLRTEQLLINPGTRIDQQTPLHRKIKHLASNHLFPHHQTL